MIGVISISGMINYDDGGDAGDASPLKLGRAAAGSR